VLYGKNGHQDDVVFEGVRVVDPVEGIDGALTVTVEGGVIARVEPAALAGRGKLLAPAFIDPHVHLRTPGREDEEDIASGTQAAAAGSSSGRRPRRRSRSASSPRSRRGRREAS
jgi:dihydroorotase